MGSYIWPADNFHWKIISYKKVDIYQFVKCFILQMFHSTIISLLPEELMQVHYPKYMIQFQIFFNLQNICLISLY